MKNKQIRKLYLSKREKISLFGLFSFMLILLLVPLSIRRFGNSIDNVGKINFKEKIDSSAKEVISENYPSKNKKHSKYVAISKFQAELSNEDQLQKINPNTITTNQAKQLHIPMKAFNNLQKYLKKGGRIKKKEDLLKIYGITEEVYKHISPLIIVDRDTTEAFAKHNIKLVPEIVPLNINECTIQELLKYRLPYELAKSIVSYRNKLGGFISTSQIKEIYNFPDSVNLAFQDKIICKGVVKKLPINILSAFELSKHPYLNLTQCKLIVRYRQEHGVYKELNDLNNLMALPKDVIQKMEPYLDFTIQRESVEMSNDSSFSVLKKFN